MSLDDIAAAIRAGDKAVAAPFIRQAENGEHLPSKITDALELGGHIQPDPADDDDRDRRRDFVGVMPARWDHRIGKHKLSVDAEHVLFKLCLVVDWRTAETTLAIRDLVAYTRLRFQRFRRALDELVAAGIVEDHHPKGHDGFVRILAYPDVVYQPAKREAALREHLAEAQSRTARLRTGETADSGDEVADLADAAIAHGATATRGNGAIAYGATAQSRTARRTVAHGATTTRDRLSAGEQGCGLLAARARSGSLEQNEQLKTESAADSEIGDDHAGWSPEGSPVVNVDEPVPGWVLEAAAPPRLCEQCREVDLDALGKPPKAKFCGRQCQLASRKNRGWGRAARSLSPTDGEWTP